MSSIAEIKTGGTFLNEKIHYLFDNVSKSSVTHNFQYHSRLITTPWISLPNFQRNKEIKILGRVILLVKKLESSKTLPHLRDKGANNDADYFIKHHPMHIIEWRDHDVYYLANAFVTTVKINVPSSTLITVGRVYIRHTFSTFDSVTISEWHICITRVRIWLVSYIHLRIYH